MFTNEQLKQIFHKTTGHCHFCGDKLNFSRYGLKGRRKVKGTWEADHVVQKAKGGAKSADNCLPACVWCNRLRWHRKGAEIRELLKAGLIVKKEIGSKSSLGLAVSKLLKKKESANVKRRRSI